MEDQSLHLQRACALIQPRDIGKTFLGVPDSLLEHPAIKMYTGSDLAMNLLQQAQRGSELPLHAVGRHYFPRNSGNSDPDCQLISIPGCPVPLEWFDSEKAQQELDGMKDTGCQGEYWRHCQKSSVG